MPDHYGKPSDNGVKIWNVKELNLFLCKTVQRIRLDCASGASHNLNRLLDKPGSGTRL